MKSFIVFTFCLIFSFNYFAITVMPMGDSITVGFQEATGSYRYFLSQNLPDVNMVGYFNYTNNLSFDGNHQGISGYSIEQMVSSYGPAVAQYQPDYVLLLAGTNNHWDGEINYESKYQSLVDVILDNSPSSKIIMATPPKFGYNRTPLTLYWTTEWVNNRNDVVFANMRDAVAKVASVNPEVIWVDYYSELDPNAHLVADAVHPNSSGQLILANLFYAELTRVIGDLDGDGDVDDSDFAIIFSNFTGPGFYYSLTKDGDWDGDGDVDDSDFAVSFSNFTGPSSALVPEPSTILLMIFGTFFATKRKS